MHEQDNAIFSTAPVPKAVAKMAIPTMLSMLITVIYNMVDTFFVGQTGDASQVAAVSLGTPVFMLIMAIGVVFGAGGSSVIARALGQNDHKRIRQVSSFCFYAVLGAGVIMIGLLLAGMGGILNVLGASESTRAFAGEYLLWISIGAPFIMLSNALSNIIRSVGAAKEATVGMMAGTVLNIILDPILILGLGWGVRGAAIATVIGNLANTAYYLWYLLRHKDLLSCAPQDFRCRGVIGAVVAVGLPTALNNIMMSVSNILLNNFLGGYGDTAVAAMGVATKANMLVVLLQLGLALGVQPLIGYNYGAKNIQRLKSITKFSLGCTLVLGVALTAVYYFAADAIVGVFISDAQVVANGVPMLRALMVSAPLLGILFVFSNALQAMGKAVPSLLLSISRQGFVFIPLLFILNPLFGLQGIIYAQPAADLFSVALSAILFVTIVKRETHRHEQPQTLTATLAKAQVEN